MENKIIASNNDIVFYKKDNGDTNIELLINGKTLWVSQKTMAEILVNSCRFIRSLKEEICLNYIQILSQQATSHKQ